MQVGRNTPCPCGSGKKYKKCCMRKDEDERREAVGQWREEFEEFEEFPDVSSELSVPPPPPPPAEPPDPRSREIDERWKSFRTGDYEEQVALFEQTLAEKELMDEEMALHMLIEIHPQAMECGECERFERLVAELRENLPEAYAEKAHFYLDWQLVDSLTTGAHERLPDIMREMVPRADRDIDIFFRMLDRLAYHGQLPVLLETMRASWPQVEKSSHIIPSGVEEFCLRGFGYALFDYLEKNPASTTASPEMLEQCEYFCESKPEGLKQYLSQLTGQAQQSWSIEDFKFQYRQLPHREYGEEEEEEEEEEPKPIQDPGRQNLHALTVEFLGYLRREEGVPYTRGEIGREYLHKYLLERYAGDLGPRKSLMESMMEDIKGRSRRKQKPRYKPPGAHQLLFPDRATLDRYLAEMLNFINPQHYKVAATFEVIPAWLRFLEMRKLLGAEEREGILREIGKLCVGLVDILNQSREDPALQRNVQQAWNSVE